MSMLEIAFYTTNMNVNTTIIFRLCKLYYKQNKPDIAYIGIPEERKIKYNVFDKYYKDTRNLSLVDKIIKTNEAFKKQFRNFVKSELFVIVC